MKPFRIGITLTGGGARGAYSAGVQRYLFTELPKKLGYVPWPYAVAGTSVGALNGYFPASHSMFEIDRMTQIWTKITLSDIFNLPQGGTISSIRMLWNSFQAAYVLSSKPLERLIFKEAARRTLRHSIESGHCKAFFVSSTRLRDGENVVFMDTVDPDYTIPPPPRGRIVRTRIYPHHLMASAAIPILFPPVRIDQELYIDGGVRQNTPLHPLLYGGSERILVISTRAQKPHQSDVLLEASMPLLVGKTLNALTLDPIERDERSALRINEIIEWGIKNYGPEFASKIQEDLGFKAVKTLHLQPSVDLGALAVEHFDLNKIETTGTTRWFLEKIQASTKESGESDLLSQLLFDKSYTAAIEELGFEDTKSRETELLEFLSV